MSKEAEAFKEACEIAAMQRNAVTVPADKLAELQRKANDLMAQNAKLKAKIAMLEDKLNNGIKVYAHQEFDDAWWCNTNVPVFNATLLLDKGK